MSFQGEIDVQVKSRKRPTLDTGEGLTKQAFKEQVNINSIMAKYRKTGMVEHLNSKAPFYGDVSDIKSYEESLQVVMKAQALFAGLSAQIRERFANDPNRMIEFLSKEENLEEAVKLGLVVKRPVTPKASDEPVPTPKGGGDNKPS